MIKPTEFAPSKSDLISIGYSHPDGIFTKQSAV